MAARQFDPALNRAGPILGNSWQRAEKRARLVDYVLNNVDQKRNSWFYFDVDDNSSKVGHLRSIYTETIGLAVVTLSGLNVFIRTLSGHLVS